MRFIKVYGEAFMSIKEIELQFLDSGVTILCGPNGSGKSTIFQLIKWIIHGNTTEKLKADDIINDKIGKNCKGVLTFIKDEDVYDIIRHRKYTKKKNALELWKNGAELKIADPQYEIDKLFEMSEAAFDVAVMSSINIFDLLPAQRKKVFEDILKLIKLDKQYTVPLKSLLKEAKLNLTENTESLISFNSKLKAIIKSIEDFSETQNTAKELLEEEINELKEKQQKLENANIEDGKKYYNQLTTYEDSLYQTNLNIETQQTIIDQLHDASVKNNKAIETAENELKKLSDAKCPKCEQKINEVKIKKFRKEANNIIDSKSKDNVKNDEEIIKATEAINELSQNVEDTEGLIGGLGEAPTLTLEELENVEKELEKIKTLLTEKEGQANKDDFKEFKEGKMQEIEELKKEIPELEKKDKDFKKKITNLEFWISALDINNPLGIKNFLIEDSIVKFNRIFGTILTALFDYPIEVEFSPQLKEKITYKGYKYVYQKFSKGEKRRVFLATSLAFFILVKMKYRNIPYLFLDEVFDNMDENGVVKSLDVLSSMAKNNSIYLIAHDLNVKSNVDSTLNIFMNKDGYTEVSI